MGLLFIIRTSQPPKMADLAPGLLGTHASECSGGAAPRRPFLKGSK